MKIEIEVMAIEPKKLKTGMLILWGQQLLQINGYRKRDNMWYIGTEYCNISLEPEFYPGGDNRRVFQPVVLIN